MGQLITGVAWGTVGRRREQPVRALARLRLENEKLRKFVDMVCLRFTENPYATCITITRYDFNEAISIVGNHILGGNKGEA